MNDGAGAGDTVENARTGYLAAVQLWVYEGALIWAKFGVMTAVNTFIIGVAITALAGSTPLPVWAKGVSVIGLSGFGLFLCWVWGQIMQRGFAYHGFYILSARELEENHLSEPLQMVSRGARFGEGEWVQFDIKGTPVQIKISGKRKISGKPEPPKLGLVIGRRWPIRGKMAPPMTAQDACDKVIFAFMVAHVVVIVVALFAIFG